MLEFYSGFTTPCGNTTCMGTAKSLRFSSSGIQDAGKAHLADDHVGMGRVSSSAFAPTLIHV
jgi:hypothetical protein